MFYILFLLISNSKNQACAAVLRRHLICKTDIYRQFLARYFAQIAVLWAYHLPILGWAAIFGIPTVLSGSATPPYNTNKARRHYYAAVWWEELASRQIAFS